MSEFREMRRKRQQLAEEESIAIIYPLICQPFIARSQIDNITHIRWTGFSDNPIHLSSFFYYTNRQTWSTAISENPNASAFVIRPLATSATKPMSSLPIWRMVFSGYDRLPSIPC